jgi:hypothetical protein
MGQLMAEYEKESIEVSEEIEISEEAVEPKKKKKKREKREYYDETYGDHSKVLELLSSAQGADNDMRDQARDAQLFVSKKDGQWEPYWWNANQNKPRYTFDMTCPIVDQVAGEIEQADFDIRVSPAGGDATKNVALTYDGIIRNLENISDAKDVYAAAARGMITTGYDGWRVVQKYANDNSFDQDLVIQKVHNFIDRVWFDPAAELQDKSDSRYCFVLHPIAKDEFDRKYPESNGSSVSDDRESEAYYDKAEVVVIGEFLYVEKEERELVLMSNGQTYEADDDFQMVVDDLAMAGITEVKRRKRKYSKVCTRFFDNDGWLGDDKDTVFNRIPVIPVFGNYKIIENKTVYSGVVEKLMDSQRVLNYSMSREIEEGALAPRAKYWMTLTQAAGHEDSLSTMNTNSDPVQFYNVDPESPQAPQQNGGAMVNPGLRTISEAMRGMIGYSAGMFASNMGDNPGLQSGVAIRSLQNKGDNATYKYNRAVQVAIAATGKLLVDAIPKVYDTERTMRILYEDKSYEMATINETVIDQQTGEIVVLNDLAQGVYDVVCKAGPSFKNRQQETLEMIIEMAKVDPSVMQIAGDIMMQNINSPAADQIAERKRDQMLKAGLIPQSQLTEEEMAQMQQQMSQQGQQQDPASVMAQAEMLKGQADMMRAQIEQAKVQNEQMKIQLDAQKAQMSAQNDQQDNQVDVFRAQTDRMGIQVRAQEAGAKITKEGVQTEGVQLDNVKKAQELSNPMANLSDAELMRIARGG